MDRRIESALPVVLGAYEYLHENPELGDEEHLAKAYIEERLRSFGYTEFFSSQKAPTAVITRVSGANPGATIALRCDLDARRLATGVEPADHKPRSKIDGLMHNCGHDAHAAILLGVAKLLQAERESLSGTVVLLFQPAEETVGGAPFIVADGILDELRVQAVFAQHCVPDLAVGSIAIEPGTFLAGSSYFEIKLSGAGSHAAQPEDGSDMPVVACEVVRMLSAIPARSIDVANLPTLISVTKIVCDSGALNVISPEAVIAGTVRAFENPKLDLPGKPSVETIMRKRLNGIAEAYGISYEFVLEPGSPPCTNNEHLFTTAISSLRKGWDGEILTNTNRFMNSEDFAYYTQRYPCLYISLGIAKDGLGIGGCHTKDFTVHPDCFPVGVSIMLELARIGTEDFFEARPSKLRLRTIACEGC